MAAAAAAPGPLWAHLTVAEAREAYSRLELTVSRLFSRASCRITLYQEQLRTHGICPRTIGKLAG